MNAQFLQPVEKIRQAFFDSFCTAERAPCHREQDSKRHDDPMVIMSVQDLLRTA